jgi:hypothetical protein
MKDLYILQSDITGTIKIGRTDGIKRRIDGLQTGSPHKIKLIAYIPNKGHLEHYFHDRLSKFRLRQNGEWFSEEGLASLPDDVYEQIDLENSDWWKKF